MSSGLADSVPGPLVINGNETCHVSCCVSCNRWWCYYYTHLAVFFSRTTVRRHQKGRTILDFNEARDGVVVASAGLSTLITMARVKGDMLLTRLAPIQSAVDRMWSRISTKIYSKSNLNCAKYVCSCSIMQI